MGENVGKTSSHNNTSFNNNDDPEGLIGNLEAPSPHYVDVYESAKREEWLKSENERIYKQSITDSLTGCYNRKYYNELIDTDPEQLNDLYDGSAIISLDLNKLKPINDNYGHGTGDTAIRAIGEFFGKNFKRSSDTIYAHGDEEDDIVYRMGGDEFTIIIRRKDYDNKDYEENRRNDENFVKNLHSKLDDMLLTTPEIEVIEKESKVKTKIKLSYSYGIAIHEKSRSLEETAKIADVRMYEMKNPPLPAPLELAIVEPGAGEVLRKPIPRKHLFRRLLDYLSREAS